MIASMIAWMRRTFCEHRPPVGVDDRGVTHALTWRFDETEAVIEGCCGATVVIETQGIVDCMTCLVREAR